MTEQSTPPSNKPRLLEKFKKFPPLHRTRLFWVIVLIAIIGIIFYQQQTASKLRNRPNATVVVAKATQQNVPIYLSALGTVTPTYSVTVKTQVNGTLLKVLFTEGQMVKAGDLLAQIDPKPYQAQLTQYEGQLARDQALLANSMLDLARYQKLWQEDSIAQQTLSTQQSLVKQYQGAIKVDQGLIAATQVNLDHTQITSPISGRVGLRLVDAGNLVQTSDPTGIVVVNMLDPITVVFSIPENKIPEVMQEINAGKKLKTEVYNADQTKLLAIGTLLTIDNQIDQTTGTVKLKAQFANKSNQLFPNEFVNVKLLITTLQQALVVPTAAIQYSPQGPFVYLLQTNQTVIMQPVTPGPTYQDNTVITMGLKINDQVVVQGADKLTDGMKVRVADPQRKQQASAMPNE